MKNPFKNTAFEFGVLNYKSMPDEDCVEVLLSGRSNAGKSSALNALAENRKLARTSKTPGRTTEINFFRVNKDLRLLDLPGYGFAKSDKSKKKDWGPMLGDGKYKIQVKGSTSKMLDTVDYLINIEKPNS